MPDPSAPFPTTSEARTADRLAELERRLAALERGRPGGIIVQAAAPAGAARPGAGVLATATPRLWLYDGSAWRYAAVT